MTPEYVVEIETRDICCRVDLSQIKALIKYHKKVPRMDRKTPQIKSHWLSKANTKVDYNDRALLVNADEKRVIAPASMLDI